MAKKTSESAGEAAPAAEPQDVASAEHAERRRRKTRVGVVASDRSAKTVTVVVRRRVEHPYYGKQTTRTKKYHAHDEKHEYRVGDLVRIVETRPLSKTKRWRVAELLERPE